MTIFTNSTVIILEQNAIFFQWNNFFCHLIGPPASTFDSYQSPLNAATKVILISCKTHSVIPLFRSLPNFTWCKNQSPWDDL